MADRDYAGPLKQARRRSVWASITRSLHLTTDWNAEPPLTASSRDELQQSTTPAQDLSSPPSTNTLLQEGHQSTIYAHSTQEVNLEQLSDNSSQSHQRRRQSSSRRLSRLSRPGEATHQQDERGPNITRRGSPAQLPPIRTHSPLCIEHLPGDMQSTPTPLLVATVPQRQQHSHATYHRNALSQLVPTSQASQLTTRINSIRRKPVHSSLRNQVASENISASKDTFLQPHRADTAHPSILRPGHRSQIPAHPLQPSAGSQASSQPPSWPTAAAHHHQRQNFSPHNRSAQSDIHDFAPTLQELRTAIANTPRPAELEGTALQYNPPLTPPPRFASHSETTHSESTISIATFDNPSAATPPLGFLQANIEGLKQRVKNRLGAKAARFGRRIKHYCRPLWDAEDDRAMLFWARVDVWGLGDVPDCECTVCLDKRGEDLKGATHLAHRVRF